MRLEQKKPSDTVSSAQAPLSWLLARKRIFKFSKQRNNRCNSDWGFLLLPYLRSSEGGYIYVDGFRVRTYQTLNLLPLSLRFKAIKEAGWNTFLLRSDDVFLDMLTDSGVNAMSNEQLQALLDLRDAYAGSAAYYDFLRSINEVLGLKFAYPVHQGRAAEHILAELFVEPGKVVITNYHFTTTKAHVTLKGGVMEELVIREGLDPESEHPFKGNMDIERLRETIKRIGRERVAFVRMEAATNLIGGQPFSLQNLREVRDVCDEFGVPLVIDGSMIDWNVALIKRREQGMANVPPEEIAREIASMADIYYASARKAGSVRGGFIATNKETYAQAVAELIPVYEGFLTYGGMSLRELSALAVGLRQMLDENLYDYELKLIEQCVEMLSAKGVPVVKPPGGLGCHVNAKKFLPHVPQSEYPAGSLAGALYLASGVRSMERGTMSLDRLPDGREILADLELVRLAVPRRTYLESHIRYVVDRLSWLYKNRELIGGLEWVYEPRVLRFFLGRLSDKGDWGQRLFDRYKEELGEV